MRRAEPQHVDQRLRRVEQPAERLRPFAADEIVGILPARQQREPEALPGLQIGKRHVDGAESRLQPGLVAVEAEDRLVRHLPEQAQLILRQRGAERRDRRLETGGDAGDHVDIALDGDDVPPLREAARAAWPL